MIPFGVHCPTKTAPSECDIKRGRSLDVPASDMATRPSQKPGMPRVKSHMSVEFPDIYIYILYIYIYPVRPAIVLRLMERKERLKPLDISPYATSPCVCVCVRVCVCVCAWASLCVPPRMCAQVRATPEKGP